MLYDGYYDTIMSTWGHYVGLFPGPCHIYRGLCLVWAAVDFSLQRLKDKLKLDFLILLHYYFDENFTSWGFDFNWEHLRFQHSGWSTGYVGLTFSLLVLYIWTEYLISI